MVSYNDKTKAVTAEDLIRRYNLEDLSKYRKAIQTLNDGLTKTDKIMENFVKNITKFVTNQDSVTAWFFNGVPTLENKPYTDFTNHEEHLEDLYYDKDTGYVYQLTENDGIYSWIEIESDSLRESLAIANNAADANDNKRTLFYVMPTPPYEAGDVWYDNGIIKRCRASRSGDEFNEVDWCLQSEYTDASVILNVSAVLDQFIEEVVTDYATKVLLEITKESILGIVEEKTSNKTDVTTVQSMIDQKASSITTEVNAKIDGVDEDLNAKLELKVDIANLISQINASAELIKILASKLSIEGLTTINGNFKIDENGTMECVNAIINGVLKGSIFKGTNDDSIYMKIGNNLDDTSSLKANNCLEILRPDNSNMLTIGTRVWNAAQNLNELVFISPTRFFRFNSSVEDARVQANAFVADTFMYSPAYNGGSLESIKKNIELFSNSALNIVKSADIYSYNLKEEDDKDKKHIGLVIGDGNKKYNTPNEIITKDNKAIDLYSMISLSWKAIQEQQSIINSLKQELKNKN